MAMTLQSSLNDMAWNDFKKYAKEQGVKVTGTRDDITKALLSVDGLKEPSATTSKIAPATESKLAPSQLSSPTLKMPTRGARTTAKKVQKPNDEKIIFTMPKEKKLSIEPENIANLENVNSNIADDDMSADTSSPKELFPAGFTNAGPLSPQIHHKNTRKPILRSPSPSKPQVEDSTDEPVSETPKVAPKSTAKKAGRTRKSLLPAEAPEPRAVEETAPEAEASVASTPVEDIKGKVLNAARSMEATPAMMIGAVGFAVAIIAILAAVFGKGAAKPVAAVFGPQDISLAGANPTILSQGDVYSEQSIALSPAMTQAIAADGRQAPTVSFEYSEAGVAFADYLADVGSFDVEYTVAAPWLGSMKLTRSVHIQDVNECTYSGSNPAFRHNCATADACINTAGSFACN